MVTVEGAGTGVNPFKIRGMPNGDPASYRGVSSTSLEAAQVAVINLGESGLPGLGRSKI
jgi:hypothetical protein